MSIVDSRSVEIYGLTIENYTWNGTAHSPAGIYVTVRSDTSNPNQNVIPHLSACFLNGGACSDIYILGNTVKDITNKADSDHTDKADCNNGSVDGYGIAAIAAGSSSSPALQHLVIEGNTVENTRTGQSETVTINGDITDFLAADNSIHDADNIGLDTIGWEVGQSQANHGLVRGNTVYSVDTYSNAAYGKWNSTTGRCGPLPENAAGLYDDGASYVCSTPTSSGTPTRASTWTSRPRTRRPATCWSPATRSMTTREPRAATPAWAPIRRAPAAHRRSRAMIRSRCTSTHSAATPRSATCTCTTTRCRTRASIS